MRTDDRRVDHGVLIVAVRREMLEHALPHTRAAPTHVPEMHHAKITEARGRSRQGMPAR